jgi:fatty acid desaturase
VALARNLRHARTTRANLVERALLAPYYVNYHCEHHMFMHMPCWSLPRAHRLLRDKGVLAKMRTADGYWAVLGEATSSTVERPRTDFPPPPDETRRAMALGG